MLNPVFADAMRAGVTAFTEVDAAAAGAADSIERMNQAVDDGKKKLREYSNGFHTFRVWK